LATKKNSGALKKKLPESSVEKREKTGDDVGERSQNFISQSHELKYAQTAGREKR